MLQYGSRLYELLQQIEIFASLQRCDTPHPAICPQRKCNGTSQSGKGVWVAYRHKIYQIMPHVAFVAQKRPVESIDTVQRMIIWHRKGTALRMVVERTYHRFQIISIEIGISIETHHKVVAALLSHNPLK